MTAGHLVYIYIYLRPLLAVEHKATGHNGAFSGDTDVSFLLGISIESYNPSLEYTLSSVMIFKTPFRWEFFFKSIRESSVEMGIRVEQVLQEN